MCLRDRFTPGSPEPVSGDDAAMRRHDRGGERYRPVSYTHLDKLPETGLDVVPRAFGPHADNLAQIRDTHIRKPLFIHLVVH